MFCSNCGATLEENTAFCGTCGTKVGSNAPATSTATDSQDSDKLFAILVHLGGIFFGFIPALIIYLMKKDSPGWMLDNAKEALNWQITLLLGYVVGFLLTFIIIGIFLIWALVIANLVLCIIGAIKAADKGVYRYPFALHLVK